MKYTVSSFLSIAMILFYHHTGNAFSILRRISYFTQKEPFNLNRMLHCNSYNLDHGNKELFIWSLHTVFNKFLGITKEYTTGDKVIAWSFFLYSFVYGFYHLFWL